jgi:hypothetical protein
MADYTQDQLMQGLRAAHDAGDEAAATAFARQIQALGQGPQGTSGSGSGQGIIPGSPQAIAQNQAANVPQPQSQIDPSHFTASGSIGDTLRALNQGITGGLWNPIVGATKSAITGDSVKDSIAAENRKSSEAFQVSPGSQIAASALPLIAGVPGVPARPSFGAASTGGQVGVPSITNLSQVENVAQQVPGFARRLLTRLGGGAAEGSVYGGVNAAANQQPIIPPSLHSDLSQGNYLNAIGDVVTSPMGAGGIVGAGGAAAVPAVTGVAGKVWNALPGKAGDLPIPTTSAELTDPRRFGGYSFVSDMDKAKAAKLAPLESMQYNASLPSSRSLPTQVSEILDKNIHTGQSMADSMGYSKDEQDALAQVGKTTPVSSFFVQHPKVAQGTISAIGELPATLMGLHGNLAESAATEAGSIAGHVAAATLPYKYASQGSQDALDQAKRIIAGQPTTTDRWNAVNDPRVGQALQSILFGQTLQQ